MEYNTQYLHPKFAGIYRNHIWAAVLEKAWAKLIGNYEAAKSLSAVNALRALTGVPVLQYLTASNDAATIFSSVQTASQKHYVMTAKAVTGTPANGIVGDRVYSVLKAYLVETTQLLLMRDPTGLNTYSGLW